MGPDKAREWALTCSFTSVEPRVDEMPLKNVTLSEIKAWRASLHPKTQATNAVRCLQLGSRSLTSVRFS